MPQSPDKQSPSSDAESDVSADENESDDDQQSENDNKELQQKFHRPRDESPNSRKVGHMIWI